MYGLGGEEIVGGCAAGPGGGGAARGGGDRELSVKPPVTSEGGIGGGGEGLAACNHDTALQLALSNVRAWLEALVPASDKKGKESGGIPGSLPATTVRPNGMSGGGGCPHTPASAHRNLITQWQLFLWQGRRARADDQMALLSSSRGYQVSRLLAHKAFGSLRPDFAVTLAPAQLQTFRAPQCCSKPRALSDGKLECGRSSALEGDALPLKKYNSTSEFDLATSSKAMYATVKPALPVAGDGCTCQAEDMLQPIKA